jgi:hypothetical protein
LEYRSSNVSIISSLSAILFILRIVLSQQVDGSERVW